uniref:Major sperm protein n=1 Tax=Plectus sambesii TaxID=2011161 RepID=A0A914XN46_9BILA
MDEKLAQDGPPQPVTDGEPLKAEETDDNKPYIKDEARNEIGLLNQCSDHILEEECPTVASTTHSSTTPASAETTIQQPSQLSPTGVGQQQEQEHQELQEDTDKGGDDGAHSEQSPSASTNMSEQPADIFKVLIDTDSNTPQSPESPQPYAPTPAEVVAVDQSSSKVDSEACPLETSRSVHDILNDSSNDSKSGGNDRTPTTALSLDDSTTTSRGDQPTDSIDPSSDGDLFMEPNGMLVFNAPFLEQALVYPVRLMNTCQFPIGYAIKSNALPHLSTDREFGVMPPGESVLFAVSCAPFSYHLENRNNDCITIEYVGVPLGVDDVDSDWFVDKGDCVVKRKNLLVQYNS